MFPITGIPCNYSCAPGEYLAVDTKEREYGCNLCPKNTYSNGGGFSIDGQFGEWYINGTEIPDSFISQCFIYYC